MAAAPRALLVSERELRGADLIGARVLTPDGRKVGDVLDVELRPKDGFAVEALIVADEPALARLVLLRQVGPPPGGDHRLVPWALVGEIDGRTIRLTAEPPPEPGRGDRPAAEAEGEATGASPGSAVGERPRADAPPRKEGGQEPERAERRARHG
jgi:sporulation protein YlmC with PRC-barrel domain